MIRDNTRVKTLEPKVREFNLALIEQEAKLIKNDSCIVVTNLDINGNTNVIYAHGVNTVLHISNLQKTGQIYNLIPVKILKSRVIHLTKSAIEILVQQRNLTGEHHFVITFPIFSQELEYYSCMPKNMNALLKQKSEPILFVFENGEKVTASIDRFEIVGSIGKNEYYSVLPRVEKNGRIDEKATENLSMMAREYTVKTITSYFTLKEIDVLRQLANGFDSHRIALNLGITYHTVETHRRNIRNISKDIFPELTDVQFAYKLKFYMKII